MPFGLHNAPASFQRARDVILASHSWQTSLVRIDDAIIFSETAEILTVLRNACISLKLKKSLFFTNSLRYLGQIVRPRTLSVDDSHVRFLKEAQLPRTELRSFLSFVNVYRRFLHSCTDKARPHPKTMSPLGEPEIAAFRTLVTAVTSPPILSILKRGLRYSIETDASSYQVGCALFQTQHDGKRAPIGFWSRKMTPAEMYYSISE